MKSGLCFSFIAFIFHLNAFGQYIEPEINWNVCYGGTIFDAASDMKECTAGGYIIAGYSYSSDGNITGHHGGAGAADFWIERLNASGAIIWQKSLGGTLSDMANAVSETSDGGFAVAGSTSSINGDVTGNYGGSDYWLTKLDASGSLIWKKTYGGPGSDHCNDMQITPDGGYILVGKIFADGGNISGHIGLYDGWVVKTDASGNILWSKCYGGTKDDIFYSVALTPEGGYILYGGSKSDDGNLIVNHGDLDHWVMKIDATGNVIWSISYGGSAFEQQGEIIHTSDNNYLAVGNTYSTNYDFNDFKKPSDINAVKIDPGGNILWIKSFGGVDNDLGTSVTETPDHSYLIAGSTGSFDFPLERHFYGVTDGCIINTDENGNVIWQTSLGGSFTDSPQKIINTSDGGFAIAGFTYSNDYFVSGNHGASDYWIVKFSDKFNFYRDFDIDNYGNNAVTTTALLQPAGYVTNNDDCNDSDNGIFPDAIESCNSIDDNCNALVDENNNLSPVEWQFDYGGDLDEQIYSIIETADNGYVNGGYSSSTTGDVGTIHGLNDFWIAKTNEEGELLWSNSFGGSQNDYAYTLLNTNDGNIFLGGRSASNDGNITGHHGAVNISDAWLIKVDNSGNLIWEKSYGGVGYDELNSIITTIDGGYIFVGSTTSNDGDAVGIGQGLRDVWIVKLDAAGNISWQKKYGGTSDEYGIDIQQTTDAGYIVVSSSGSNNGQVTGHHGSTFVEDFWLFKIDNAGNLIWQKSLGGTYADIPNQVRETADGGFVITGNSRSKSGDVSGHHGSENGAFDVWVVKTDATGNIQWNKSYGGTEYEYTGDMVIDDDGNFILNSGANSTDFNLADRVGPDGFLGGSDFWLIKIDAATGNFIWKTNLGGYNYDEGRGLLMLDDGSLVVNGITSSVDRNMEGNKVNGGFDMWLAKLNHQNFLIYNDNDNDGFGEETYSVEAMNYAPCSGMIPDHTDCNDSDININPAAIEICNSLDDDCDASIDENVVTATTSPAGSVYFCPGGNILLTANAGAGYTYQWIKNGFDIAGANSINYTATAAGNYQVKSSVPGGCFAVSSIVTVNAAVNPKAKITAPDGTDLCGHVSLLLKAKVGAGYFYQWKKDGVNITGATAKNYSVTTIGNYQVTETNPQGCSKTSANTTIVKTCKVSEEETVVNNLNAFPNPASDILIISFISNEIIGDADLTIVNMLGQIIYTKEINSGSNQLQTEINVKDLNANGIYFVRLICNQSEYVKQVVVEN